MPPTRRFKVLAIALTITICTILYLSNDSSSQEFYSRTVTALDRKESSDGEVANKLSEVKNAAKAQEPLGASPLQKPISDDSSPAAGLEKAASAVADSNTDSNAEVNTDEEKSVAGRKTMKGGEHKDLSSGKKSPKDSPKVTTKKQGEDDDEAKSKETNVKSEEDHEIETELNTILRKGPIIIFSKSFCPYSAKAKKILLEKYTIVPAPYVVELDTHPLGRGLQNALEKSTGRRTVPNVLINGRSIGGGDDIQALDESGGLIDKVKGMGGKRVVEAKLTETR